MIKEIVVRHHEYISTKPFEDVVAAFEAVVGTLEDIGWDSIPVSSKDAAQFEAKVKERIGSSGFTRFLTIDHGRWLTMMGQPTKMRMYTIGNPLIAITMLRHDVGAGLNVPVRVAIYWDEKTGSTLFAFDQPSTLMSSLHDAAVTEAAEKLDAKMFSLAEDVTGSKA